MKSFLSLLLFLLPALLLAQGSEVGLSLNAWNYQGDIVTKDAPYLEETQPGFGLFFRHTFHNNLSVVADAGLGWVSGNDLNFEERMDYNPRLDFSTRLLGVSGMLEWNILGRERRSLKVFDANGQRVTYEDLKGDGSASYYDKDGFLIERRLKLKRSVSPYLALGAGLVFFDPTLNVTSPDGRTVTQKELDQDYSKINLITPISLGVRFYLTDTWTLNAGVLMMPTFADYIDGASDSRNPADNDWLSRFMVGISYRL